MASFQAPVLPANPKDGDWKYFIRQFDNYIVICAATAAQQLPLLLNCLGRDGIDIFDGLPAPKGTLEDVKARFAEHFNCRKSLLLRRKAFYTATQGQFEAATDYACRLRRLATDCDFGEAQSALLRDIFVIGVCSDRIGERLLTEDASTLTFEGALARAEAAERAMVDRRTIGPPQVASVGLHQQQPMQRHKPTRTRAKTSVVINSHREGQERRDVTQCFRCGSSSHKANSVSCPAKLVKCNNCSKVGHFAKMCRSCTIRSVDVSDHCVSASSGLYYDIFCTASAEFAHVSCSHDDVTRRVTVNGHAIDAICDSGAEISVLPKNAILN